MALKFEACLYRAMMMLRQKNRTTLIFMALFLSSANAATLVLLALD